MLAWVGNDTVVGVGKALGIKSQAVMARYKRLTKAGVKLEPKARAPRVSKLDVGALNALANGKGVSDEKAKSD